MPDDILEAIPENDRATHRKPRWHQVIIRNGEWLTDKSLEAQGQTVPVRLVDGLAVRCDGHAVRSNALDLSIQFDPANDDHLELMVVLDRIIKAAHAARQPSASLEHG
jgi:hypothetical protein